jgi:hypothetical protein
MTTANSVYTMIASADTSGIESFTTLFAYEGFNPEMVHQHFAKIMNDKDISQGEFTNDMRALITLGAMKGNYTMKNAGKISQSGKDKADALYKKYQLKQGSLGNEKKAIILPRVLSAFPELTTKVILRIEDRNFGTLTNKLPKFIKNPVFPALIPKSLDGGSVSTLLWLYSVYSAEQSLVISEVKDLDKAFTAQKGYAVIAFNSSVPPEPTRVKMFKAAVDAIVQAVSDHKDLEVGIVPPNRVGAAEVRSAINSLSDF